MTTRRNEATEALVAAVLRGDPGAADRFLHRGRLLFAGADFHGSPLHAVDADATVAGVLAFLSLKPGDTDPDYFEGYTPEQLAFARAEGENLSLYVDDLERR